MSNANIYSIGYGSRSIGEFVALLKRYDVKYLIDIRSQPHSKFNPSFNKRDLEVYLVDTGIRYVFMGDLLGGRPRDKSCYTDDGRVDYLKVKEKQFYKEGIERLKTAYKKGLNVALMCSEINPAQCHRSKLIGTSLCEDISGTIEVKHIDEVGIIKDHHHVMKEVTRQFTAVPTLFNDISPTTSRRTYVKTK